MGAKISKKRLNLKKRHKGIAEFQKPASKYVLQTSRRAVSNEKFPEIKD